MRGPLGVIFLLNVLFSRSKNSDANIGLIADVVCLWKIPVGKWSRYHGLYTHFCKDLFYSARQTLELNVGMLCHLRDYYHTTKYHESFNNRFRYEQFTVPVNIHFTLHSRDSDSKLRMTFWLCESPFINSVYCTGGMVRIVLIFMPLGVGWLIGSWTLIMRKLRKCCVGSISVQ